MSFKVNWKQALPTASDNAIEAALWAVGCAYQCTETHLNAHLLTQSSENIVPRPPATAAHSDESAHPLHPIGSVDWLVGSVHWLHLCAINLRPLLCQTNKHWRRRWHWRVTAAGGVPHGDLRPNRSHQCGRHSAAQVGLLSNSRVRVVSEDGMHKNHTGVQALMKASVVIFCLNHERFKSCEHPSSSLVSVMKTRTSIDRSQENLETMVFLKKSLL